MDALPFARQAPGSFFLKGIFPEEHLRPDCIAKGSRAGMAVAGPDVRSHPERASIGIGE
ncbi:hypothetical protein [Stappia sp. TSB10GB4]|uniref:hypothetical protein n=1 Tax=Stappia sp. TSB10GB4 TaxID=2003584 RepID=UPI001645DBE9|nr:hypothetical protein [Stappia sp. TSB10GB4]